MSELQMDESNWGTQLKPIIKETSFGPEIITSCVATKIACNKNPTITFHYKALTVDEHKSIKHYTSYMIMMYTNNISETVD